MFLAVELWQGSSYFWEDLQSSQLKRALSDRSPLVFPKRFGVLCTSLRVELLDPAFWWKPLNFNNVWKWSSFPTLWALLLIKETCQLCFPSRAWWNEAGGACVCVCVCAWEGGILTLMRKCGTTSKSRGWLPGTQPVHTSKKKKDGGGGGGGASGEVFGMQILGIMWDFAAPDFDGGTVTGVHR